MSKSEAKKNEAVAPCTDNSAGGVKPVDVSAASGDPAAASDSEKGTTTADLASAPIEGKPAAKPAAKPSTKPTARKTSKKSKSSQKSEASKGTSSNASCKKCSGSLFGKIKCFAACGLLLYAIFHIATVCPLGEPLNYETTVADTDYLCKSAHVVSDYVSPYVEPVVEKVHAHYDESAIKPYVDKVSEQSSLVYNTNIKPVVDVLSPKFKQAAQVVSDGAVVCSAHAARHLKNGAEFTVTRTEAAAEQFSQWLKDTAVPATLKFSGTVIENAEVLLQKLGLATYTFLNVYVKPALASIHAKLMDSKVGELWRSFQETPFYKFVVYTFDMIILAVCDAVDKVTEIIAVFNQKEHEFKLSAPYKKAEEKAEFLKNELAKMFNPGFKIPDAVDLGVFKKLNSKVAATETAEAPSEETSVAPVEETSEAPVEETSVAPAEVDEAPADEIEIEEIDVTIIESDEALEGDDAKAGAGADGESAEDADTDADADVGTSEVSRKYQKLVDNVISGAEADFTAQVSELSKQTAAEVEESLRPNVADLGSKVSNGYKDIHVALHNINTKKPGEAGYVSRQDYRDVLADAVKSMNSDADEIYNKLKTIESEYVDKVLAIRTGILETLSEFSDSTLSAYSNEIIKDGDDWAEWKRYNSMKKELLGARDELLAAKPENEGYIFKKVEQTVRILLNEGESYLAIMRAKGNIEFQMREKAEREAIKAKEAAAKADEDKGLIVEEGDEDEDEYYVDDNDTTASRIKTTIVRTVTYLSDDAAKTPVVEVDEESDIDGNGNVEHEEVYSEASEADESEAEEPSEADESSEAEKSEAEKSEAEKSEAEKSEAEKSEAEKSEAEKSEAEKSEAEESSEAETKAEAAEAEETIQSEDVAAESDAAESDNSEETLDAEDPEQIVIKADSEDEETAYESEEEEEEKITLNI